MSLTAGTLVDHYRVERPIGCGAFATVYLAHDDRLDAPVALKVLAENRALDMDARRRFVEEAQKLRKVRAATVLTVFDVGETESHQPYMVLEYADRGDLSTRHAAIGRPTTLTEVQLVAEFLFEALRSLHKVGLVHRDVKPQNILIRSEHGVAPGPRLLVAAGESLLLGDLGFVKDLSQASGLTVGGGTWTFQAPEQKRRLTTIDHRADVYSATAVLAWLATGSVPFEGSSWAEVIGRSDLHHGLRVVLEGGLAESPNDRPVDMSEWRSMVSQSLSPPQGPARHPTAGRSGQQPASAVGRAGPSRRVLVGAATLFVAAVVGYSGGVAMTHRSGWPVTATVTDGVASTRTEIDDRRVVISGPSEIGVGEMATFMASIEPDTAAFWLHDGILTDVGSDIVYVADTDGHFAVTLLVVPPGSEPQLVVHRARAVEP